MRCRKYWLVSLLFFSAELLAQADLPADKRATKETVNLYHNLKRIAAKGFLFGHQDDLAYGVKWKYENGRSDVKDIVGDYPALYGWELGNLELDMDYNLDSVPFAKMRQYIQQGYQRGGAITISWHLHNPLNGASAWDTTKGSVAAILPGGAKHKLFTNWLDKVAVFMQSLRGKNGEAIPVIFRPFHELTGSWFWWGPNECSPAEIKQLWRFTFNYLTQTKKIHNLLYVYNTGGDFKSSGEFLERYPGDDVADVVSFDSYGLLKEVSNQLGIVSAIAKDKNKIIALAEVGDEAIPVADWWTNNLLKAMEGHNIAYTMLWRNAGLMPNGKMHYYTPFKGDVSEADFIKFYQLKTTLFERDAAKEKLYE